MDNVDVTDEGDKQGVPTYVQAAHSDEFDQYVWPPTTKISNFDDFIGEKPKVENVVWPVKDLENAEDAHNWLNHISFSSKRASPFFHLKLVKKPVV